MQKSEKIEKTAPDLKIFRDFMKIKNITFKDLSKEMNYSTSHICLVFKKGAPPSSRFLAELFKGMRSLLRKDLYDFYEHMRGTVWSIYLWDVLPSKDYW